MQRKADVLRAQQQIQQKRRRAKAQIEALQAELDADEIGLKAMTQDEEDYLRQAADDKSEMERSRKS
jgi:circadian clock protein KaiC